MGTDAGEMKERPLQSRIVYGPVESRRLGRSLGVNVLPTQWKVCTFDCIYCQYGWTCCQYDREESKVLGLPGPTEVEDALADALPGAGRVDAITLAGNGEPTLHPQFGEIARVAAEFRNKHLPGVPVVVLSNSSTITEPSVREAFRWIDRPIMKLDAGNRELFSRINRPRPEISFDRLIECLADLEGVEIQSIFFEGEMTNCSEADLNHWLDSLERIRPVRVQIYSLDRTTAISGIVRVSPERLEAIARLARERLPQTRVDVF